MLLGSIRCHGTVESSTIREHGETYSGKTATFGCHPMSLRRKRALLSSDVIHSPIHPCYRFRRVNSLH